MAEANKIALDIEGDGESGLVVILGDFGNMMSEAFLPVEDALFLTARIGINAKTTIPPFSTDIIEKMVDNAITERGCDDFASDGVVHHEGNTTIRLVIATQNAIAQ